jgi:hypothetical protein
MRSLRTANSAFTERLALSGESDASFRGGDRSVCVRNCEDAPAAFVMLRLSELGARRTQMPKSRLHVLLTGSRRIRIHRCNGCKNDQACS